MSDGQQVVIYLVALLFSVCFHEAAHGWVAWRNGDPTAKLAGRITLNPIPHVDIFGSILFPALLLWSGVGILLAWAKPVPVDPRNFRNPRKGFAWVSVAGPGSNLLLAAIAAVIIHLWSAAGVGIEGHGAPSGGVRVALPLLLLLITLVKVNVYLALFNLLPIPPLDGGHFLVGVLPPGQSTALQRVEPFGMFIIMALAFSKILWMVIVPGARLAFRLLGLPELASL